MPRRTFRKWWKRQNRCEPPLRSVLTGAVMWALFLFYFGALVMHEERVRRCEAAFGRYIAWRCVTAKQLYGCDWDNPDQIAPNGECK